MTLIRFEADVQFRLTWCFGESTEAPRCFAFVVMMVPLAGLWLLVSLRLSRGIASSFSDESGSA